MISKISSAKVRNVLKNYHIDVISKLLLIEYVNKGGGKNKLSLDEKDRIVVDISESLNFMGFDLIEEIPSMFVKGDLKLKDCNH